MPITTKTLNELTQDILNGWGANLNLPVPTNSGDPVIAIAQTVAAQLVYLESLILRAFAASRASTATGTDLDTWVNDFGVFRIEAQPSTGDVTLIALSAHATDTFIPVDKIVQTTGGAVQFLVKADATKSAWVPASNSYRLLAGQTQVTVFVEAAPGFEGTQGNVAAGTIVQLGSAIPGIDSCTNALAFANGADEETDEDLRARFITFLNNLSKATRGAILNAIQSITQIQSASLFELVGPGSPPIAQLGSFLALATDSGAGTLSGANAQELWNAVDLVRGFTIAHAVQAPSAVTATIVMTIRLIPGLTTAQITAAKLVVQTAIANYINSLAVGETLYLEDLTQVASNSTSSLVAVQAGTTTINAVAADLVVSQYQVARSSLGAITVGTF